MAARDSSRIGMLGGLVIFAALLGGGAIWGMVYVPPYFANREVATAVKTVTETVQPVQGDEEILRQINQVISSAKTAHYWVEEDGQHQDLNFQLKPENITIARDGNRSLSVDVSYSQEMFVPLLKKTQVLSYSIHADSPQH